MPLIKFNNDQIVNRLRWVMIGGMLFSVLNTLAGQPANFWHHPEIAIRGDGLSIDNETNHSFEFFLGCGWQPYLIANLIYFSGAFLLVSVLPRRAALITIFSFIFGHYFSGCNWLAVRWHLGIQGPMIYGLILGLVIVLLAFNDQGQKTGEVVKRLRWVVIGTLILDIANTLLGQPAGYWHNHEIVYEANEVSRFFLVRGWYAYLLMGLAYSLGIFWLESVLPRKGALICIFYFILVFYIGASNWFFYQWRMGIESPVIYGMMLSVVIVWLTFFFISGKTKYKLNA
jgi:hypothetical protein